MEKIMAEQDFNVNSTVVRAFINKDNERPVTAQEFMEFWKAVNIEERQRFGDEARQLMAV